MGWGVSGEFLQLGLTEFEVSFTIFNKLRLGEEWKIQILALRCSWALLDFEFL